MSNRPNSNSGSRNSETSNPMRRSFSGNPFTKPSVVPNPRGFNPNTPANSPSDFPRRNSIGRDLEDKENTKDHNLKPGRVRSPAVASKATKNFMSPTISAASKITPSPKKKILVERNEPARASLSLSTEKSPCNEPARTSLSFSTEKSPCRSVRFSDIVEDIDFKADDGSDDKEASLTASSISEALRCEEVLDPEVPVTSKIDSKSLPETVTEEPDCVNLDPTFKISPTSSCSWSCPVLAPLDADPSVRPYDPKTNYLSPRPQFLHYRPNPRIEVYLNKESDGQRLEESFISECFSDTEVTEETQSEDVSSVELVKDDEEEEEEEKEVPVSEPSPISTHFPKEEETIGAKGGPKPQFFTRSKFILLLLVLSVACLSVSVTNTPVNPSMLKESSFFKTYDSYVIAEFAKVNLDGLARNSRLWYDKSISFVSELIPNFKGVPISGPLHYCNLTALREDIPVDGYLVFDHSHKGMGEKFEHNVLGSMREREVDIEPLEEEDQQEIEADEDVGEALEGLDDPEYEGKVSQEIEEVSAEDGTSENEEVLLALETEVIEPDNLEAEKTEEEVLLAVHLDTEQQSSNVVNYGEQPAMVPKADEIQPQVSEAGELQGEHEKISIAEMESAKGDLNPEILEFAASAENLKSSEVGEFTLNGTNDRISRENVMGITMLVLTLIAATVFRYVRKGKNTTPITAATNVEQPVVTKKLDFSPMSVSNEHAFLERRPASQNWPTEVDMVGESCPSEMSSFSSYSKKGPKGSNEAQSQERKPRKNYKRESLASSSEYSTGSPSYGSFTTYEKIPSKLQGHGGDEETIITPVRRSSRIRSQVTSP